MCAAENNSFQWLDIKFIISDLPLVYQHRLCCWFTDCKIKRDLYKLNKLELNFLNITFKDV